MSKLKVPIYNVEIYGYVNITDAEFRKELKRETRNHFPEEKIKGCEGDDWYGCVENHKEKFIVRFKEKRPNKNTIVHEAFHLTTLIMDYVGVKLSDESDEAYAYLLGYITDSLYGLCNQTNQSKDTDSQTLAPSQTEAVIENADMSHT